MQNIPHGPMLKKYEDYLSSLINTKVVMFTLAGKRMEGILRGIPTDSTTGCRVYIIERDGITQHFYQHGIGNIMKSKDERSLKAQGSRQNRPCHQNSLG